MSKGVSTKTLNSLTIRAAAVDFDKSRWAELEKGLKKEVDRQHYEVGSLRDDAASLTEQILSSYKTGAASDSRTTWMHRLAAESMRYLAHQRGIKLKTVREETLYNRAVSELIDRLFDLMHAYSIDFNHMLGWNELRVTCTRPSFVTEILRYNKFREPIESVTNCRARLSTRFMSLVIRGTKDSIDFIFLPVEKVIGLSRAESAYEPVCQFKGTLSAGKITWHFGENELSSEQLEVLCMDLFSGLIERTKQESKTER